MVVYLLLWLALSAVAALAFVFGSSVGYRRGFEEATALAPAPSDRRAGDSLGLAIEVRLPEDIPSGT